MTSIKLATAHVEMAREMAAAVGRSVMVDALFLRFDAEDAVELLEVAGHAVSYWSKMRKPGKARVANAIREKLAEIVAAERYARSFRG